jgi:hypothetical protein
MQRRTLLQSVWILAFFREPRLSAQAPSFPGSYESVLKDLAAAVLPESMGRASTDKIAIRFVRWVQEYRPGAEMQAGYGFTRIRYKPASPAPRYLEQLTLLASTSFSQSDLATQRREVQRALQEAKVNELPFLPDGTHLASDLMAFYFQSSEAADSAYSAAIGRDKCRGLKNSGETPIALREDGLGGKV